MFDVLGRLLRLEEMMRDVLRRLRHLPDRLAQGGLGASSQVKIGVLLADLTYRSATGASVEVYGGTPGSENPTGEVLTAYAWMLRPGDAIAADAEVVIAKIGGVWYVINAQCPPAGS